MKLDKLIVKNEKKELYLDGKNCVKVFSADFKKSDVFNEALNQARVEDTGLSIPKIKSVEQADDGRYCIVMDYVEGKSLETLMAENPKKEDEYLKLFVDIQCEIHSKSNPLLNKLRDKMERKIGESGLDATTRYELNVRLNSMPKHSKLCHGDFNPSNVIIDSKGNYSVIDWAHATQGNASADVARTYLLFNIHGQKELADKYLKLFCEKTDTAVQYVQQWLPVVAASQLVKGKPEEREILNKWASVCQYE